MANHFRANPKRLYNLNKNFNHCNCHWGFNICQEHVNNKHLAITKFETLSTLFAAVYHNNFELEKKIIDCMNQSVNKYSAHSQTRKQASPTNELRKMENVFDSRGNLRCTYCGGRHGFAICLRRQGKCFHCHQYNHFIAECPQLTTNLTARVKNINVSQVPFSNHDTTKICKSNNLNNVATNYNLNENLASSKNKDDKSIQIESNKLEIKLNSPVKSFNKVTTVKLDSQAMNCIAKEHAINILDALTIKSGTVTEPEYLRSDYFKLSCDISQNNLALSKNNYKLPQLLNSCSDSGIELNMSSTETDVSLTKLPVEEFINFKSCVNSKDQTDLNLTPSINCTIQSEFDNLCTLHPVINNDFFRNVTDNLALCKPLNKDKINNTVGTPTKISDHMSNNIENLNSERMDDQVESFDSEDWESISDNSVESSEDDNVNIKSDLNSSMEIKVNRINKRLFIWSIMDEILENVKYKCIETVVNSESITDQLKNSSTRESESISILPVESNVRNDWEITNDIVMDTRTKSKILSVKTRNSVREVIDVTLMCLFSYIINVDRNGKQNGSFTESIVTKINKAREEIKREVVEDVGLENLKKMDFVDKISEYCVGYVARVHKNVMLHYPDLETNQYLRTYIIGREIESIYVEVRLRKDYALIILLKVCDEDVNEALPNHISSDDLSNNSINPLDQQSIISNSDSNLSIKLNSEQINNNSLSVNIIPNVDSAIINRNDYTSIITNYDPLLSLNKVQAVIPVQTKHSSANSTQTKSISTVSVKNKVRPVVKTVSPKSVVKETDSICLVKKKYTHINEVEKVTKSFEGHTKENPIKIGEIDFIAGFNVGLQDIWECSGDTEEDIFKCFCVYAKNQGNLDCKLKIPSKKQFNGFYQELYKYTRKLNNNLKLVADNEEKLRDQMIKAFTIRENITVALINGGAVHIYNEGMNVMYISIDDNKQILWKSSSDKFNQDQSKVNQNKNIQTVNPDKSPIFNNKLEKKFFLSDVSCSEGQINVQLVNVWRGKEYYDCLQIYKRYVNKRGILPNIPKHITVDRKEYAKFRKKAIKLNDDVDFNDNERNIKAFAHLENVTVNYIKSIDLGKALVINEDENMVRNMVYIVEDSNFPFSCSLMKGVISKSIIPITSKSTLPTVNNIDSLNMVNSHEPLIPDKSPISNNKNNNPIISVNNNSLDSVRNIIVPIITDKCPNVMVNTEPVKNEQDSVNSVVRKLQPAANIDIRSFSVPADIAMDVDKWGFPGYKYIKYLRSLKSESALQYVNYIDSLKCKYNEPLIPDYENPEINYFQVF